MVNLSSNELWTIKYAPKNENDIVGNPKAVSEIKKFLKNWSSDSEIKALLLLGPPGCGKTTSTHLLAKLNNYEVIEINASDVRNKQSIEDKIIPSLTTKNLKKGWKKLYLIDEVDGLSGSQDRGGLQAMLKAVQMSKFPIIFTANDISDQKFSPLKNKKNLIKIVKFQKIRTPTIVSVLKKICKAEKIEADPKALEEIAFNVNNDLRSAINDLQAIAEGKNKITVNDVRKIQQNRDVEKNIFEVLKILFTTDDIGACKKAISMLDIDLGLLIQWVNESLPHHSVPKEALLKSYEYLSKADLIWNHIQTNPEKITWTMLPYYIDLIIGATEPIKKYKEKKFVQYFRNFPSFYYRSFSTYSSGELYKIINKIKDKLKYDSIEIFTKHLPYIALILRKKSKMSEDLIKYFELDKRDITFIKKFA